METTFVSSAFLEEIASASVSASRAYSTAILVAVTDSSSAFLEDTGIASASLSAFKSSFIRYSCSGIRFFLGLLSSNFFSFFSIKRNIIFLFLLVSSTPFSSLSAVA